jgi:Domain of unknown function (DUF4917)
VGDERLDRCHDFLTDFSKVFTANYDLLLCWAVNRKGRAHFDDGFRRRDGRLLHVEPDEQTVSWLHGAVHFQEELVAGDWPITMKEEWAMGIPLVDRLRENLENRQMPLIVMEGTWQQKQTKINSSPYLSTSLRLLRELRGSLFTYGLTLSANDFHIRTAIQNSDVSHLYVGLYGNREDGSNPDTIGQAHSLSASTGGKISVEFGDTSTAPVW